MTFIDVLRLVLYVVAILALGAAAWLMLMLRGKLGSTLENLSGTLNNVNKLSQEITGSGMLAEAKSTLSSARARVEDLAALQHELQDTSVALADLMTQLRDQNIGVKVGNLLSDASTLMADVGMLAESASSVLETGRPLVKNASDVISSAKRGVKSIAGGAAAVKEGVKAGIEELTGH
jgi:hypothetical protein